MREKLRKEKQAKLEKQLAVLTRQLNVVSSQAWSWRNREGKLRAELREVSTQLAELTNRPGFPGQYAKLARRQDSFEYAGANEWPEEEKGKVFIIGYSTELSATTTQRIEPGEPFSDHSEIELSKAEVLELKQAVDAFLNAADKEVLKNG